MNKAIKTKRKIIRLKSASRTVLQESHRKTRSQGGLNLAVKRAKPNSARPTLSISKQLNEGSPMRKYKKPTAQEARRAKAATAVTDEQNTDGNNESPGPSDKSNPHA